MKKLQKIGCGLVVIGTGMVGPFALLSGLRQLDAFDSYLMGIMIFGMLVSLVGLYFVFPMEEA